jgi:hypothetical protein
MVAGWTAGTRIEPRSGMNIGSKDITLALVRNTPRCVGLVRPLIMTT